MTKTTKIILLLIMTSLGVLAATLVAPIPQDPAYHNFTDTRTLYGINNFWNVATNIPFLLFGILGLYKTSQPVESIELKKLQRAYTLFFTGAILVSFGASYYHLNPTIDALLWDRIAMSIAFMSFLSIIISEFISLNSGRLLLLPLLVAGAGSVIFWYQSEQLGTGDLRAYAVVQFLPMILIPVILILFKSAATNSKYIWALLLAYLLSKVSEYLDVYIYNLSGEISGHSLKHIFASIGIFFLVLHFSKRAKNNHD